MAHVKTTKQQALPFKKPMLIGGGAMALLVLVIIVLISMMADSRVYGGVRVNDVHLGNLTLDEAERRLEASYTGALSGRSLALKFNGQERVLALKDIEADYDLPSMSKAAHEYGRVGNLFLRMGQVMGARMFGAEIKASVVLSGEKLEEYLNTLARELDTPVTSHGLEVLDDQVEITNGRPGYSLDVQRAAESIADALARLNFAPVELEGRETPPTELTADILYDDVYTLATDAHYAIQKNDVQIIPEVVGRSLDKSKATGILNANRDSVEPYYIPLDITMPQITRNDLRTNLFTDTLGEFQSQYNAGDKLRTQNVQQASKNINGTVLAPGDTFSYNNIVGERTIKHGFATAKVYQSGEIVDGLGGGICQVSSTLYNAVLLADLEITQRKNHQLTVSYVPLGQDATVAWGSVDFVFKNRLEYPVKITSSTNGGTLTIKVLGTKTKDTPQIELVNQTVRTINYSTIERSNSALGAGETSVKQKGSRGYVVDTYRIVKKDGKEISRAKITTSHYNPTNQIIEVGPGGSAGSESPSGTGDLPVVTLPPTELPVISTPPSATPQPSATTAPTTTPTTTPPPASKPPAASTPPVVSDPPKPSAAATPSPPPASTPERANTAEDKPPIHE